jgi:threonyl-tRNA synthetase
VNGEVRDLQRPLTADSSLVLLDFDTKEGQYTFWHSSAHVLGQALEKEFSEAKLCIGPPVEEGGFYYDVFMGDKKVHPDDYKSLERTIAWVQKQKQPFVRLELTKAEALEMFKDNQFKQEILNSKVPDGATCTAYRCGPLIDLCRGPHVPHTGVIKAMAITKHSSSYWLAKAENASLQRVYGVSFPNKEKLKEWKAFMKLAEVGTHMDQGTLARTRVPARASPAATRSCAVDRARRIRYAAVRRSIAGSLQLTSVLYHLFCLYRVFEDRDHRRIGQQQELFFFHKWSANTHTTWAH